jgi:hypothetical protein
MKAVSEALSGMLAVHETNFKLLLGAHSPNPTAAPDRLPAITRVRSTDNGLVTTDIVTASRGAKLAAEQTLGKLAEGAALDLETAAALDLPRVVAADPKRQPAKKRARSAAADSRLAAPKSRAPPREHTREAWGAPPSASSSSSSNAVVAASDPPPSAVAATPAAPPPSAASGAGSNSSSNLKQPGEKKKKKKKKRSVKFQLDTADTDTNTFGTAGAALPGGADAEVAPAKAPQQQGKKRRRAAAAAAEGEEGGSIFERLSRPKSAPASGEARNPASIARAARTARDESRAERALRALGGPAQRAAAQGASISTVLVPRPHALRTLCVLPSSSFSCALGAIRSPAVVCACPQPAKRVKSGKGAPSAGQMAADRMAALSGGATFGLPSDAAAAEQEEEKENDAAGAGAAEPPWTFANDAAMVAAAGAAGTITPRACSRALARAAEAAEQMGLRGAMELLQEAAPALETALSTE